MTVSGVFLDPAGVPRTATQGTQRALFLDRDGVINVDHGYVHRAEETEWIPGIFALCRTAIDLGFLLVVVTNQAGIARGLYSEAAFLKYTRWMHARFAEAGAPLVATYYCPHHPDFDLPSAGCMCRKPAPGMIWRAADELALDVHRSMLIGDKDSDVAAGRAAGVAVCLRVDCRADASDNRGLDEAKALLAAFAAQTGPTKIGTTRSAD